jgi:hypothetical protein
MADCPTCEYHKQRAQIWRDEAYKLAGHPLPRKETMTEEDDDIQDYKKPWVGLSEQDINELKFNLPDLYYWVDVVRATEKRLKEKNT